MPKPKFNDAQSILDMGEHHNIVFTDGGCHPNNKSPASRGGYAACFVSGPYNDVSIYGNLDVSKYNASNIRAEGMAIIRALEYIYNTTLSNATVLHSIPTNKSWRKTTVITDCEFWINMVESYMPKWNKNTFEEKSNTDLTQRLWKIYKELSRLGDITFMHIKSHNKEGWRAYKNGTFEKFCYMQNDYVDNLCNYSRIHLQPTNEMIQAVEYE